MTSTHRVCVTCDHYRGRATGGHCHRYPPFPLLVPEQNVLNKGQVGMAVKFFWPTMGPKDGCGEWMPQIDPDKFVKTGEAQ